MANKKLNFSSDNSKDRTANASNTLVGLDSSQDGMMHAMGSGGMMHAMGSGNGGTVSIGSPIGYSTQYTPGTYNKLPDYVVSQYATSDTTNNYLDKLNQLEQNAPGAYESKYGSYIDNTINSILNREKFNYDFNADSLYQQYKDNYTKLGNEAATNAAANTAALTGGYGSSYATTAASQANQQYLTQLNNVIPQLASLALDQYKMETEDMYNQYGMLSDAEQQNYGKWVDERNFYNQDRAYYQGAYQDSRNYDLNKWSALENANYNAARYNQDEAHYGADYDQSERQFGYNYALSAEQFEEQKRQWAAEFALRQAAAAGRGGSGGSGGGSGISVKNVAADEGKYGVSKDANGNYQQMGTDQNGNPILITYNKYGIPIDKKTRNKLGYNY